MPWSRPVCTGSRWRGREDDKDSVWLALFWTGPVGVGAFLARLGVLFWRIAQVQSTSKKQ